jgi:hypothetical protein
MPGLPNTHVIPPGWEQHHRPVSADAMPGACVIVRPTSTGTWDAAAGRTVYPPPTRIYPTTGAAPCRITRQGSQVTQPEVGDRTVPVAGYRVAIGADAPAVLVNDIVQVVTCAGDPALAGQDLVVRDAARGSLTWQRDMDCDLYPATAR